MGYMVTFNTQTFAFFLLACVAFFASSVEAQCSATAAYGGACGSVNGVSTCCPGTQCCSQYGYCGEDSDHCLLTSGCQSTYGTCSTSVSTAAPTTTSTSPTTCSISANGACGGNVCCPSGQCCSQYNYCGIDDAHCGAGCQTAFGVCTGSSGTTAAPTTTTTPPPVVTTTTAAPVTTTTSSTTINWASGKATCYGDYRNILSQSSSSLVSSGLTNQAPTEDWTYATAISTPGYQWAGACYAVKCVSGVGNAVCNTPGQTLMLKVVDTLAASDHLFDISAPAFGTLGNDQGNGCSGYLNLQYYPISCNSKPGPTMNQIVGSNSPATLLITPNECDPWLPKFLFTNLGGALYSVWGTPNAGNVAPVAFTKQNGEWAAWTASGLAGQWLNNQITFTFEMCALAQLPGSCVSSGVKFQGVLAENWCPNGGVPCNPAAFQLQAVVSGGLANFPVIGASSHNGVVSSSRVGVEIWIGLALSLFWALL